MRILDGVYSLILAIGDMHMPYNHHHLLPFLRCVKDSYQIDVDREDHLVISIGDEADGHGWSFHDKDPELASPGAEFRRARTGLKEVERLFPKMKILESNHGSLHLRKQKAHGLPKGFFKNYNEAWDVGPNWEWLFDFAVRMSNGKLCYFHHGKTSNVMRLSQSLGMCAVQGHYHEQMGAQYWRSPAGTFWAAQTGCLVDIYSLAMAYGRNNLKSPCLGSLMILNGHPISVPLVVDDNGDWIGRLV